MITEDAAKTKWCPFASGDSIARERVASNGDLSNRCIGSACMAWRVGQIVETMPDDPNGLPGGDPVTATDVRFVGEQRRFLPALGFCGLAGGTALR